MRRILPLLALSCCATVPQAIPSSLPYVRIDGSLSGVVASEAAGKWFLHRMAKERAQFELEKAELEKEKRVLTMQRDSAERFVQRNAFWSQWGMPIAVSSGFLGLSIGLAIMLSVVFGGFHGK